MKKSLFILFFGILISSCSSSKGRTQKKKYFNENNVKISKSKFRKIRATNRLLDIPGDSAHHRKLTLREKRGKITNRPILELLLENEINREIDSTKPIVIIFYPGKDPCNSSGSASKEQRKYWFDVLEDGIYQLVKTKPIYIYKEKEGLEKYHGVLTWHKDPNKTIERLFFEHHYPCSSFVVISKDGDYISFFGEFGKKYLWGAIDYITK
tara:strand:+ start:565 stop:1194 length:630 start_codon:yes stop_codon:yes gene_type:complete